MARLKTHRGIKKRFKFTKSGRIKYFRAGKSHILTKKQKGRKRMLRRASIISADDQKKIRRALPYG